ncbi:hypothetical protein JCM9279_001137 [Rhodotorula babjevae]
MYRTEKLSRSVVGDAGGPDYSVDQDGSVLPEDMATQSVRLKEDQLRREEQQLRDLELRSQRELAEKRQELLAREEVLRNLEARLAQAQTSGTPPPQQQQLGMSQHGAMHPNLTPSGYAHEEQQHHNGTQQQQ